MQIVIPMSGFGERFKRAGYEVPKFLIEIEGKTIIEHVIDLFPGETDFTFICNRSHLEDQRFSVADTLRAACPTGRIVSIEPHKLGPVHAVSQIVEQLDPDRPVIVNYCDFTCSWDYSDFKRFVRESACDGAIACYTGFHPHMLGSTNYGYVRVKGEWVQEIQEKQPFTESPMDEYASSGTYYFASGLLVREYFAKTIEQKRTVNDEYYVSLVYCPLLEDGKKIAVYEFPYFMQWGTPEDFRDYKNYSDAFRQLSSTAPERTQQAGAVLIAAAGEGSRFAQAGYALPKPLVSVSGKPMLCQALDHLPASDKTVIVLRRDVPGMDKVGEYFAKENTAEIVYLEGGTSGQAVSCLAGSDKVAPDRPLTIGACDNGVLYQSEAFEALMEDPDTDVIIWGFRGHPGAIRSPEAYGWIESDETGSVKSVSVKEPLSAPATDAIVIGVFTFKRADDFRKAATRMIKRDGKVNGEFYVDTCINDAVALGLSVKILECSAYLCWGTPDDLSQFSYWQRAFDSWASHPYSIALDPYVDGDVIGDL
jgi:NDP-sugar pyrophosphorylase family protein